MKYIPIVKQLPAENLSAYKIIQSKVIDHAEVVINFFDYCNMQCVFCPQDHTDRVGTSKQEILSKAEIVLDYIRSNSSTNTFLLHLMGGELFQDDLIDGRILEYFSEFIDTVESKKRLDATVDYNFITNLIFDRTDAVLDFVRKHNLELAISYDSAGRFNKSQLERFKQNVEIFKPYIRIVSCVMTQENINRVTEGDGYFDYLYSNFDCHWDHLLIADTYKHLDQQLPSESQLRDFYIHLVDNYPNTVNVQQFLNKKDSQKMSCTRGNSLTIFSDNSMPHGCSGSAVVKNSTTEFTGDSKIVHNFIDSNMCLSCKYYSRCNLTCFIHNDYKNLVRDASGCPYQQVFEYAEGKNSK
jgi:sulfatase maturation enzyme AslB (radical SAM superfamily)